MESSLGRVLVLDGRGLVQAIQADGYTGESAATPDEALDKLKAGSFDLLLIDAGTAGHLELVQKVKASRDLHHLPIVVAYTPDTDRGRVLECLEAGAEDYLPRPFQPGLVGPRLRRAMEHWQLVAQEQQLHDQIRRLAHEMDARHAEVHKLNRQLAEAALMDQVTGLPNRRATLATLRQTWALANRQGQPMSCLLIDVDRMKMLNEKQGTDFGDDVLRGLAHLIQQAVRISDIIGHYAEEAFVVLCPDTNVNDAFLVADRVRVAVAHHAFERGDAPVSITVSIGVAEKRELDGDPQQMLRAADDALHVAKQAGRNRVMVAEERALPID